MILPALVPELSVSDAARSRAFYCDVLGFSVRYDRPEEGFCFLDLGASSLMIDQAGTGRDWMTGSLEPPFGRGINLQFQVVELAPIVARLDANQWPLFQPVETKTYQAGSAQITQRQFCVQDPDGYLLRFCQLVKRLVGRPTMALGCTPSSHCLGISNEFSGSSGISQ